MSADDQICEELVLPPKIISPATFGVVVLLISGYFTGHTYATDPRWVFGFAGLLAVFAVSHFVPVFRFGKSHAFYLYTYHWLLCFMMIFIVPTISYFLFLWIMFIYLAEYFYQVKGTILSAGSLLVAMLLGSLYQHNELNQKLLINICTQFLLIVIVSQVVTRLAFGDRVSRRQLAKKIVKYEYEHGRMVALINSMNDAVIATDENGRILTYNAAALDLLDTNATLSDMNVNEVLKLVDSNGKAVDALSVAEETSYIQRRVDLSIPLGEEDKIDLDMNVSRIARSTILAKQLGYTFLLRDITKQKSLDEERDLFISEVSHELRTPITIAEGNMSMAVLLTEKQQPNLVEVKSSVKKAHDQVIFLADMVNDLSALSRAERDDVDIDIEQFDVKSVLKELEESYRPQAEKKNLFMHLELDDNLPLLTTSRFYFKEIMQNFITNSLKYTAKGGITITCQKFENDYLIVGVKDTGEGISKSDQAKVFKKFWRSEDPYTRSTNGTGLGLFITSKLVHRIGGEIKLESELKVGSTFSLLLPLVASVPEQNQEVVVDQQEQIKAITG